MHLKLLVIDGNSILNRAIYGIKVLTTKDGRFTNGIYGFMNILLRLREECSPDGVAIAFDMKNPTFRHEMYKGYKAQRKGMPEELAQQLPVLKELLTALGFKIVEISGFEADDILGTLAKDALIAGMNVFLQPGTGIPFSLSAMRLMSFLP
jgi:DNA polymerase-1